MFFSMKIVHCVKRQCFYNCDTTYSSCFPSTIINRVLMCGLKDFCVHGGIQAESGMVSDDSNMPKFASVVGILGHLASQHGRQIKAALMELFKVNT